jgi:hypothetical protein
MEGDQFLPLSTMHCIFKDAKYDNEGAAIVRLLASASEIDQVTRLIKAGKEVEMLVTFCQVLPADLFGGSANKVHTESGHTVNGLTGEDMGDEETVN